MGPSVCFMPGLFFNLVPCGFVFPVDSRNTLNPKRECSVFLTSGRMSVLRSAGSANGDAGASKLLERGD